mmetsp:Transcript_72726/g.229092  ORF Transcript_72726/g.229092 Transcript_72726/m.229092 type:complete len:209 (-) Transcript_72726:687-1313(-)
MARRGSAPLGRRAREARGALDVEHPAHLHPPGARLARHFALGPPGGERPPCQQGEPEALGQELLVVRRPEVLHSRGPVHVRIQGAEPWLVRRHDQAGERAERLEVRPLLCELPLRLPPRVLPPWGAEHPPRRPEHRAEHHLLKLLGEHVAHGHPVPPGGPLNQRPDPLPWEGHHRLPRNPEDVPRVGLHFCHALELAPCLLRLQTEGA